MENREIFKNDDLAMIDKFNVWCHEHDVEEKVKEYDQALLNAKTDEGKIIAMSFKRMHLYVEKEEELKAYITYESSINERDAAVIIGTFMRLSSLLDQEKLNEFDQLLHNLDLNESRDRRSFTIKRLLNEYNQAYRLENTLKTAR